MIVEMEIEILGGHRNKKGLFSNGSFEKRHEL